MTNDPGVIEMRKIREVAEAMPLADSLAELLDSRAKDHPDQVLANFFHDDTQLTYGALAEHSKRLASGLLGLGVRKGTHVGIAMGNCSQFVVTWFSIARLGAIMVPVNNRYKPNELDRTLRDADVQFLLIDVETLPTFEAIERLPELLLDGAVIMAGAHDGKDYLDFDALIEAGDPEFEAPVPVNNTDLLSIQFTSGSTGRPKGCMQSHLYWLTLAATGTHQRSSGVGDQIKNVLVTYPLFYMQAQAEFMLALQNSGTAFVSRKPSLSKMMDWVRAYSIHYCAMNPMVYHGLPKRADDGENELRYIAAYYHKGDNLRDLETRFNALGRDTFGMTEIGSGTSVPASATHMLDGGTCGLPSAFREVSIRDEQGNLIESGKPGELCFAGQGIFWGYYKRPQANRDSFHHGRWLRTGDLAYTDENGYVFIIGRIKEMIKRSGENVSAMEVEQTLRQHPGIREVAVVSVPDKWRMEEVRAVVTLKDGASKEDVTPENLQRHCRKYLADFKVPRYFGYVDKFPRTGSKKIDKNLLIKDGQQFGCMDFDLQTNKWCVL